MEQQQEPGHGRPRLCVIAQDGWVALEELVTSDQLDGEHARRCLAERILWAVRDAERRPGRASAQQAGERELVAV